MASGFKCRPITDTWILARCKYRDGAQRYGGYPGGFPERARALLGVSLNDPVLHVCAGRVRDYPYHGGVGPHDRTLDLDPATEPDFLADAREPFPAPEESLQAGSYWPAVLMDPPYTEPDAEHYSPGSGAFPTPNLLLRHALHAVRPGGRVGLLHYQLPAPPRAALVGFETRFVAAISVLVGFNNRVRIYSVFERLAVTK